MEMKQLTWHAGPLPDGREFARVHAVLVVADGRLLLRYKNGEPRVTGGHIDSEDVDLEAAVRREVLEEINCQIDRCDYFGYVEFQNEAGEHELWARVVARVSEIGTAQPDPDRPGEWIYGRSLMPLVEAHREMDEVFPTNREVLTLAWQVADEQGYFTEPRSEKIEVLNLETHQEL